MFLSPPMPPPPTGIDEKSFQTDFWRGRTTNSSDTVLFNAKDYQITGQVDNIHQVEFLHQIERRFSQIMLKFRKIWEVEKDNFSPLMQREMEKQTSFLLTFVLATGPQKISVDVTPDGTIFTTAIYADRRAYLELHFEEKEETELIFNIYQDAQPASGYGARFFEAIAKYISLFQQ